MLLLTTGALSLILHTPPDPPAIVQRAPVHMAVLPAMVPTTAAVAGLFGDDPVQYKGGADSLDLGSLLDSVPADKNGGKGQQRDQKGLERLKERQAEESEAAKEKYEAVLAAEAKGKEVSFQSDVGDAANAGIAAVSGLFGR